MTPACPISRTPPLHSPIRPFAIVLVFILVPLNCWWVVVSTLRVGTCPTQVSLFFNAIFTLAILLGINALIRRFYPVTPERPALTLNHVELLVIYTCVSIGSGIAGVDRIMVLAPLLGHAHWFASAENDWAGLFLRYVPNWLTISDRSILDGYYHGVSTLYTWKRLNVWIPVVLWWSLFIVALHLVKLALSLVVRKQWVETERLSYPVIQLPHAMTRPGGQFFRSPWMWLGVGIGAAIDVVNGLHFLFPVVPSLGGSLYDLNDLFKEKPWNAIGWSPMAIFPFAVGMSFFIPLDLAFSCWAFWLIWRAERILFAAMGHGGRVYGGVVSFEAEQSHGAYLGLCVLALWMSRRHLANVFRQMVRPTEPQEIAYRLVLVGLILGAAVIGMLCLRMGMSLWVIVLFFVIWYAISLAITRLRAELGSPVHDLHFIGPDEILPKVFGTRQLGSANLTGFSYLYFINRAHRSHIMPHQLEGFKLAEMEGIPLRRFAVLMLCASVLGAVSSLWAYLTVAYEDGGSTWAWESFNRLERWLNFPTPPDLPALGFAGIGLGLTLLLAALRMRFLWWYLHPVGYAISGSWAINPMIGSIFVGWLLKWLVLRFGGIRWHRNATPFFLGLIFGEFMVGTFWSLLGMLLKRETYRFLF